MTYANISAQLTKFATSTTFNFNGSTANQIKSYLPVLFGLIGAQGVSANTDMALEFADAVKSLPIDAEMQDAFAAAIIYFDAKPVGARTNSVISQHCAAIDRVLKALWGIANSIQEQKVADAIVAVGEIDEICEAVAQNAKGVELLTNFVENGFDPRCEDDAAKFGELMDIVNADTGLSVFYFNSHPNEAVKEKVREIAAKAGIAPAKLWLKFWGKATYVVDDLDTQFATFVRQWAYRATETFLTTENSLEYIKNAIRAGFAANAAAEAELDHEAAQPYEVVYTAEKAADADNVVLFAPADDLQKPTTDEVICKFCKLNPYKITECRYGCQLGRAESAIIKLPLIQPYYTEPAQAKSVRYGDITPPAILCENCGQNIAVADRDNCAICGSPTEPKTDLACKRCGGQCVDSKGFKTDVLQQKDSPNQVMNTSNAAGLVDCKKCKDCGHSFVPPTPTNPSDLLGDYPADLPPTSPEKPLTQRGYIEKALGYIETLAALHREGCADKGRLGWLISEAHASLHKAKYAETPPVHLSLSVAFVETRKTHTATFYRYKAKSELVQMWAGSKLIPTEFSGIVKLQTVFDADGSPFVEITEAKNATTLSGQSLTYLELRDTDGSLYEPQRLIDEVLERAKTMFI